MIYYFFLLIYGLYFSFQDIRHRKIKNNQLIIFSLIIIPWTIIRNLNKIEIKTALIITLIIFLISVLLHYKKLIGAADGKLFIILSIIISFEINQTSIIGFLINTFIFYSISFILYSNFKTTKKEKLQIIKKINFKFITLYILIFLSFTSTIIFYNKNLNPYIIISIIILGAIIISSFTKKIIKKLDENSIILIGFTSFAYSFYQLFNNFPISFISLFIIKSIIDYISSITDLVHKKGFNAPFAVFIILGFLWELIMGKNILLYIFQ